MGCGWNALPVFWTHANFQLPKQHICSPLPDEWPSAHVHLSDSWRADCNQLVFLSSFFFMRSFGRRYARRTLGSKLYLFQPPFLGHGQVDLPLCLIFAIAKLSCTYTAGKPQALAGHILPLHCWSLTTALSHQVAWYGFQDPVMNPALCVFAEFFCKVLT